MGEPKPGTVYRVRHNGEMPKHITGARWRPSIHMPRWASRVTLKVTNVRIERLQEIGEADAVAEGAEALEIGGETGVSMSDGWSHRDGFCRLWDAIQAKRAGCSWADNPWVWVVEFWRVQEVDRG